MATLGNIIINDVGPRDGLQNQNVDIAPQDRIVLIEKLLEAGLPAIEIGSFVNPKAVPRMAGAAEIVQAFMDSDAILSVLVPNMRGFEMARNAGARRVNVVPSATETMNRKNINMGLEDTINQSCSILRQAAADGVARQAYIAVAIECPFEGKVNAQQVLAMGDQLIEAGAEEIIIADSIGAGNPMQVHGLFTLLVERFGADKLSAHFHDTRAMGLANAYAALECGIRKFDASIGGLGGCPFAPGAAGNLATEDLVAMVHQMGFETGINQAKLKAVADFSGMLVGQKIGGRMAHWLDNNLGLDNNLEPNNNLNQLAG